MGCLCETLLIVVSVALLTLLVIFFFAYRVPQCDQNQAATFFSSFVVGAHRGLHDVAPENSLASFAKAAEAGADLVELDVALSADGEVVVIHDDDTERTAEGERRVVAETKGEELRRMRLKNLDGSPSSERIPTLAESLELAKQRGLLVLVDVKSFSNEDPISLFWPDARAIQLVSSVVAAIESASLHSHVIVCSFSPAVSFVVKQRDQRILTGLTLRRNGLSTTDESEQAARSFPFPSLLRSLLASLADSLLSSLVLSSSHVLPRFVGADLLLLNHLEISPRLLRDTASCGFRVGAWTVNSSEEAAFLHSHGVPFLTDRNSIVEEIVKRKGVVRT